MRFLLLDRIVELERGRRASGIKNVTLSEDFFTHHFPDQPIMPGTLITECMVQLADWVIREASDFEKLSLPVSFDRLKFYRMVRPSDQLLLDVEVAESAGDTATIRANARCGEQQVAAARFTVRIEPSAPYQSSEAARAMFQILQPPPERMNAKF